MWVFAPLGRAMARKIPRSGRVDSVVLVLKYLPLGAVQLPSQGWPKNQQPQRCSLCVRIVCRISLQPSAVHHNPDKAGPPPVRKEHPEQQQRRTRGKTWLLAEPLYHRIDKLH